VGSNQASSEENQAPEPKPNALSPDTRPLTGAQPLTLGFGGRRPLYLLSRFQFRETADTNPGTRAPTGTQFVSVAQMVGSLALQRSGSASDLAITYAAGSSLYFYNKHPDLNLSFHQLALSHRLACRRWGLLLADQASYLPESSFGFGGFGSLNNAGSGANLLPAFIPNQTILTGIARRISNAAVADASYQFSPRTALTATVSYGVLRFLDRGFIDSTQLAVQTGYNQVLNDRDTIGLIYGFSRFSFQGVKSRIENHLIHFAYGRRVTGRMALQFTAGPRMWNLRNTPEDTGARLSWSMGGALSYRRGRDGFSLGYQRDITGGSGVFLGTTSDAVQVGHARDLFSRWTVNSDFGYARNVGLQETNLGLNNLQFQTLFGGTSLNRRLGRSMSFDLSYRIFRQASDNSVCILSSCGRVFLRHQLGLTFSFDWSPRPIRIE
jgi:hypothetical protein